MKIVFVCKHNRFRSKVAETIFNKLNKNKSVMAESAGLVPDSAHPYVAESVIKIMDEMGYKVGGKPRQLTRGLLEGFDMLVIVANDIDKQFFHDFSGKILQWDIPDCDQADEKRIREIIDKIEGKVRGFVESLNNYI
ncbi:hypothetical protein COV15_00635 [Candidatus Woesearchaeota archaeon CG10_big_fil_rev_8_21_14_0_10_34_12]|nr:MAG: hypothetical protein COV15_00635 [Candidatus Woesearchaeota archaeon CG10_big_fil_rev_8_21_14_0_10_34_12]